METTHYDAIIIGAGISGISAAYHLQTYNPGKTYAVLERRDALGGTWDLFNSVSYTHLTLPTTGSV